MQCILNWADPQPSFISFTLFYVKYHLGNGSVVQSEFFFLRVQVFLTSLSRLQILLLYVYVFLKIVSMSQSITNKY